MEGEREMKKASAVHPKGKKRSRARRGEKAIAIVLERDVAAVFPNAEAVNSLLRSVIASLRRAKTMKPVAKRGR
jgi:hypothetical protein